MSDRIRWEQILPKLKVAKKWALESSYPEGALISHHGIHTKAGSLHINFSLNAIVFSVEEWKNRRFNIRQTTMFELLLKKAGLKVTDKWGGEGHTNASFSYEVPFDTPLSKMVALYREGCPKTGKHVATPDDIVYDSRIKKGDMIEHETGSVFCHCGWYSEGSKKAKIPRGWN